MLFERSMPSLWPTPRLLPWRWCCNFESSHCNSLEDCLTVDTINGCETVWPWLLKNGKKSWVQMVIRNTPRIVLIYSSYHVRTLPQTSWKSACSFVGNVANIQTERLTETTAVITKILLLMAVTRSHLHHDDVIKWKPFSRYWPFERGIPLTKASAVELWSVPEQTAEQTIDARVFKDAIALIVPSQSATSSQIVTRQLQRDTLVLIHAMVW